MPSATLLKNMFEVNCTGVKAPTNLSYTTATVSGVLCLITVGANLLVCTAVWIDPKKDLRNPFNWFVVNLAIADLLVGAVAEPIFVYYHIREGLGESNDDRDIKMAHVTFYWSCTASMFNFTLLAYERYVAIATPLKYRYLFCVPRFITLVSLVWLTSIGLTTIYFFIAFFTYALLFINIAVAWTLAVFLFTYAKILRTLHQRTNDLPSETRDSLPDRVLGNNVKLTKTYMIMLSTFLVCYTPACVIIYIMNFCQTCTCRTLHYLRDMQLLIVLANSAVNPFVYAFRYANFRRAAVQIVRHR